MRLPWKSRLLAVGVMALSLTVSGVGAATAGVTPHQTTSQPSPVWATGPERGLSHPSHAQAGGPGKASQSGNWSGYTATGASGAYTTVSASWIVPWATCLSSGDGTVSSWVGLDGAGGSPTVEQTGTAVDCTAGYPQYYAWWETYPNPVHRYSMPVSVGETVSATISYTNGQYDLVLSGAGWAENTVAPAPAGTRNSSAEVISESGGHLPNFWVEPFTGATINGGSLAAAGVYATDMINSSGAIIDRTAAYDSAGNFTIFYGTSDNPATFCLCAGGGYQSEFSDLLDAGGCTGPYSSAVGGDIVNIANLSDIDQIYDGTYTVQCDGSVGPLSNGSINGVYFCPAILPS